MVSVTYALTKKDYVSFYTYVMWDAPGNNRKRIIHYTRQLLPIILFLFAFYYTGLLQRNGKFILLITGFMAVTTLLSLTGIRSNTMKQGEKIAEDPGNSSLFLEQQLSVGEHGISLKDQLTEIRFQWKAIIKKSESKQYYFLFYNSIQAILIPKRVFRTADEKEQFDKLLTRYLTFDADVSHLLKK